MELSFFNNSKTYDYFIHTKSLNIITKRDRQIGNRVSALIGVGSQSPHINLIYSGQPSPCFHHQCIDVAVKFARSGALVMAEVLFSLLSVTCVYVINTELVDVSFGRRLSTFTYSTQVGLS